MSDEEIRPIPEIPPRSPLVSGGFIPESRMFIAGGHDGPELVYIPKGATVVPRYPPAPLTWAQVSATIHALPDKITREDVPTIANIIGVLAAFGFPESSEFRETSEEEKE